MSIDSVDHHLPGEILQINIKSNQMVEINRYCQSILQDNGILLTLFFSPNSMTCLYVFYMHDHKIKYKILRVECKNRKLQSIRQYFKVAEIYEYELCTQYGFKLVAKIIEEDFKLVTPDNPFDLLIHQKSSQIKFVEVGLGFHYRNLENNLMAMPPAQILNDISKLFNTCTSAHQIAFVSVIERLSDTHVSTESKFSRMLVAELERVTIHLIWLGMMFMGMGRRELSLEFMQLYKKVLLIKNNLIGNNPSVVFKKPAFTLSQEQIEHTEGEITALLAKIQLISKYSGYGDCLKLLSNVGSYSFEESTKYGLVGPITRAAGVEIDVRVHQPYLLYNEMRIPVVVGKEGTLQEIVEIRLKEVRVSFAIINQILQLCSPWQSDPSIFSPVLNANATAIVNVEAPHGRLTYFVQTNKKGKISQFRITIPSITNFIPTIKRMLGADMKWLPSISRLFDMGIDPLDNLTVIDMETGQSKSVAAHEIRQSSMNSILLMDE